MCAFIINQLTSARHALRCFNLVSCKYPYPDFRITYHFQSLWYLDLKSVYNCSYSQKSQIFLEIVIITLQIVLFYQMVTLHKLFECIVDLFVKSSIGEDQSTETFRGKLFRPVFYILQIISIYLQPWYDATISSFSKQDVFTVVRFADHGHHLTVRVKRKDYFNPKSLGFASDLDFDCPILS